VDFSLYRGTQSAVRRQSTFAVCKKESNQNVMLEAKLRLPLLLLLCESKIVASIFVRVAVFFSTTFPVKTATNQKYWKNV